jgi:hypothetical protein
MRRRPVTSKQPDPEPEDSAVKLQRMDFKRVEQDDHKAVYTASIEEPEAVCTLTVTVARPRDEKEELELKRFLKDMEGGFVLTEPNLEEDTADDREPDPGNLDTELQFVVEVRPRGPDRTLDATVVVKTAIEAEEDPGATELSARAHPPGPAPAARARDSVLAGKDHRWSANGGYIRTATATARQNSGTLRRQGALDPHQDLSVGGGSRSTSGSTVWVRGGGGRLVYDMSNNFHRS